MTKKITLIIFIILILLIFQWNNLSETIQKQIYPKKYEQYVDKYSQECDVDNLLIYSIIKVESNFNEKANSHAEAIGLMQLMENTAVETYEHIEAQTVNVEELYQPEINIKIGTYYFSTLLNQYNNVGLALAAYNAGMGRVDKWTKQAKSTTTNAQGQYEFSNIEKGRYFVLFVYDAAKYSVTEYQKEGVDTSVNSDAIDVEVLLNGEKTIAGMTDTIEISNSNLRDIDIGLYVQEKFDLRLDKYISKITRTTPTSGTDIFDYSNEKLTKIEVLKKNLGKSSIVVEYKIVVKNEGAVAGYAKKVVDYLPKGVVFNTELNKDWYLSDNGNVYNTSLENTIINPGETKELTLVLVKQITEDSIGVLNNTAEIYEAYNEQGLKDIDSTPANKVETEDDMSKADIVLGIVTGAQIAIYIILPLVVISLLGFGIFAIRKRVLKKV